MRGQDQATDELRTQLDVLVDRNRQLEQALKTRVVIEQAKGVLAERLGVGIDEAFGLLRHSARSERIELRALSEQVISHPAMPYAIVRGMARESRWRAVAMRERSEAVAERAHRLHEAVEAQAGRLARNRPLPPH
jgi:hypothetical protein